MYEERFGTDWTSLDDREEAVRRAFALGVAARMDEHYPGELDRISDAVESSYDRSFVELAYHEGRDKAERVEPEPGDDADDVWGQVVEGTTQLDPSSRPEPDKKAHEKEGLPGALGGYDIDSRPDDSREAVSRPKFLSREDAEEPEHRRRRRRSRKSTDDDDDDSGPTEEEREEFQEILEPDDGGSNGSDDN